MFWFFGVGELRWSCLAAEAIQGAALPLQSVDHIHGGDGLPLGVLSVGDSVPDDVLKEDLEDTTGLLVDEARDTLDTATARQTADGRLGDALDVVPEDLPVALSASLSESLASFATSGHVESFELNDVVCQRPGRFYAGRRPLRSRQLDPALLFLVFGARLTGGRERAGGNNLSAKTDKSLLWSIYYLSLTHKI